MTEFSPLWQMQEACKARKLLIKAYTADIERYQMLLSKTMKDLEEYETAVALLSPQKINTQEVMS